MKFSFSIYPMFKTQDGDFLKNVVNEDKYLREEQISIPMVIANLPVLQYLRLV